MSYEFAATLASASVDRASRPGFAMPIAPRVVRRFWPCLALAWADVDVQARIHRTVRRARRVGRGRRDRQPGCDQLRQRPHGAVTTGRPVPAERSVVPVALLAREGCSRRIDD